MSKCFIFIFCFCSTLALAENWNNPYTQPGNENTAYLAFASPPKTLDPARSYSADDMQFIAQIYEPPLQYHYLKRPYQLTTLTAAQLPEVSYFDQQGQKLTDTSQTQKIAYTIYQITLQPGVYFQPHPAFARNEHGEYYYFNLTKQELAHIRSLNDFKHTGTRELTADDYVYQIKRLANPAVQSPILGLMSHYIAGLVDLNKKISASGHPFVDLRKFELEGAKAIDRYHYQIKILGFYPQFQYWLAMPFFAPIPWEADYFYSQTGLGKHNISWDWYPVGTGPYMMTENNPNQHIVLDKNPYFHTEYFPTEGEPGDAEKGYLQKSGQKLPFIDRIVFSLDRESIPRWNKFLQGYYDVSGVSDDNFDQAIHLDTDGNPSLTRLMKNKGIHLTTIIDLAIYYIGFNMLDPLVGGYSPAKQKLRQALSIALNQEEFISIFLNGRGIPAQGPIPPGIFGYQSGQKSVNAWIYTWQNDQAVRRPLSEAKVLLKEAGYSNGRDPKTGKPLLLNYDLASTGGPDENAQYNWYRKQFAQLGIDLNIRATLYNRFQDNMRTGAVQMFSWGWSADYPDAENFLFLLYGPAGMVKFNGENAANYTNPRTNELYREIAALPNNEIRLQKISEFVNIVQQDSPWIWGFNPETFVLRQVWMAPTKPNAMSYNTLKYSSLDGALRAKLRQEWNRPQTWPLWVMIILILVLGLPLVITYWIRENSPSVKRF